MARRARQTKKSQPVAIEVLDSDDEVEDQQKDKAKKSNDQKLEVEDVGAGGGGPGLIESTSSRIEPTGNDEGDECDDELSAQLEEAIREARIIRIRHKRRIAEEVCRATAALSVSTSPASSSCMRLQVL